MALRTHRKSLFAVSLMTTAVLAVGGSLALLPKAGRTQGLGHPVKVERLPAGSFPIGSLIEGNAPPLEAFHPDVLPPAPVPILDEPVPAPDGLTADFRHYLMPEETIRFLEELERERPDLVDVIEIGRSTLGRPILAARLANENASGVIEHRPAMYIDGQHHAREFIGQSTVLYALWRLVDQHGSDPLVTHLLDTRVVYAVPSVNPDGGHIAMVDNQTARKTANPLACDDDGDGDFDEDYSVGYGFGTHTLTLYHFRQEWADEHPDDPFVGNWTFHLDQDKDLEELGRFTGAYGGPMRPIPRTDRDGDRRQDEDEIGGTDPNRNYGFQWEGGERNCRMDTYGGEAPWSEAESRVVRDFVAGIDHISTALTFHSGIDRILHPWGYAGNESLPDDWVFERLARKGSQLTQVNGFPGSAHTWTARGLYRGSGSSMDYMYGQLGAYTFTPEVYGGSSRTFVERLGTTATFTVGTSTGAAYNPPPDEILATTDRWNRFTLYILATTPNIEMHALTAEDDWLAVTLGNDGALQVDVTAKLIDGDGAVLASLGPELLWSDAPTTTWRVPLAPLNGRVVRLAVEAVQPAGTVPHRVEREEWTFEVRGSDVLLRTGSVVPPANLDQYFPGGWWAGDEWDVMGRFHLPGSLPLPHDPSPTPTPKGTATPEDTSTPTATTELPSPTPTASASPTPTASATTVLPSPTPTSASTLGPASKGLVYLPFAVPGSR